LRDLNFVADTVEGFLHVADSQDAVGEVINIGAGKEISMADLVNLIMNLMDEEIVIVSDDMRVRPDASEVDRLCADVSKARKLLNWQPKYSLKKGLQKTIDWVKDNLEIYRPDIYNV